MGRGSNITCKSDVGSYTYNYGSRPHAVLSAGNITMQYDANGNMTQRAVSGGDTLGFTYNQDNMPVSIAKNGNSYVTYTYDASGQRIKKTGPSSTVLYFGEVYEERTTTSGTVGIIHLFAGSQRVASIRTDGYEQYYHPDHLGSASIVTDQTGTIQEKIEYFPFGSLRERSDYSSSFPDVNYTFTGQESDDEVGLYNFKARLYDPVLGRFLSADSVIPNPGDLQSYNRYSYCQNNPVVYTDPSGHWSLGGLLKSFVTGLVAAATFAAVVIIEAETWGTGTPLATALAEASWGELAAAGAAAGAVGGGTGAALNGGNILQWVIVGAAIGGVTGGITGGFEGITARAIVGGVFTAAGAGAAYAQGGLDGLVNFGAGLAGAWVGAYAVNAIADPPSMPSDPQNWNYVKATREGLVGYRTSSGQIIGEDDMFVSLPDTSAKGRTVDLFYNGKLIENIPVKDVGPWNVHDPYWESTPSYPNGARPLAEFQVGTQLRPGGPICNGAGIDLSNKVYTTLRVKNNDYIYWKFH